MHAMEMDFSSAQSTGRSRGRAGVNSFGRHYPSSIYRTSDGWVGISTVTPAQWQGFCAMTGRRDLGADPRYTTSEGRTNDGRALEEIFVPVLRSRPSLHWFEEGLKHRLALAIVPSMPELLAQPVHRERGAFVPVRIGTAQFEAPVLPQRLGEAGPHPGGTAPLAGAPDGAQGRAGRRSGWTGPASATGRRPHRRLDHGLGRPARDSAARRSRRGDRQGRELRLPGLVARRGPQPAVLRRAAVRAQHQLQHDESQ